MGRDWAAANQITVEACRLQRGNLSSTQYSFCFIFNILIIGLFVVGPCDGNLRVACWPNLFFLQPNPEGTGTTNTQKALENLLEHCRSQVEPAKRNTVQRRSVRWPPCRFGGWIGTQPIRAAVAAGRNAASYRCGRCVCTGLFPPPTESWGKK